MDLSIFRVIERPKFIGHIRNVCAVAGLAIILSACGGGGGGGGGSDTPVVGSVAVTVKDLNGFVVPGATVTANVSNGSQSGTTDANGTITLASVKVGSGTVTVSRVTFKSNSVPVTVMANQTTTVAVALERDTQATGGVVQTRVLSGGLAADGESLEFSIQVVVVDDTSSAIAGLLASAFTLQPCTTDAATTDPECVSGPAGFDAPYVFGGPGPAPSFQQIAGGLAQPYAAALSFDQSLSIKTNDPTDARLFSAREFLARLGGSDRASLSAFASGSAALIPNAPVTIYPVGSPGFVADGSTFYPTLDTLAKQEGGTTPLYDALCQVMTFAAGDAGVASLAKAVVVFTDGKNEGSTAGAACKTIDQTIAKSVATGVRIYTIGLSNDADGAALAELADGGNGVFMFAENTEQLVTIYGSLGNLLSGSLTTYKLNYVITTDVAGAFAAGRAVLGTLRVDTGSGIVNLPFIVRIF